MKKRRVELFQFNDFETISQHLSRMAEKGWMLEETGSFFWTYRQEEPARRHYTVVYNRDASDFSPGPTEEQQTYRDYCRAAGWEYVCNWNKNEIFVSDRENPVPIESDERVKLENSWEGLKKLVFRNYSLIVVLILIQWASFGWLYCQSPDQYLSNGPLLASSVLWLMLLIYLLFVMVDTALWYRSAKRAVEAGGRCPQGNYRLRKMMACWMMVCSAAAVLFTLWWVLKQENRWIMLPSMGVILLSMGLGFLLRKKLKRTGVSAKRNLILVMIFQLLVMFAAISALVWWGISSIEARQEAGSIPYTVTNNGHTMTFTLYRDQLPLTLEDLGYEVDKDIYSYRLDQSSSPVFSKLEGDQDSYASLAGEETWDLSYTVYRSLWSDPLDRLTAEWQERNDQLEWEQPGTTEREDLATLWGAQRAWSDGGREMMIRYPKCLLLLRTDVQLKEEQVEIIRQKLNLDFQAEE